MNRIIKGTLCGLIGLATISGTYFGRANDDYPPLYSHKTGISYGINFSIATTIDSGAVFYGVNIALFNLTESENHQFRNGGCVNGLDIALGNITNNNINGLAIGIANYHNKLNGLQIGAYNHTKENSGLLLNVDLHKNQ